MTTVNHPEGKPAGTELVIERVFAAPPQRIWQAWTEPELFKRWWGAKTFTTPVSQIDFRLGGRYLYCMRAPDGQDVWGTGVYREIVQHQRIVFTDAFADAQGNPVPGSTYGMGEDFPDEFLVIVTFKDIGNGQTRQTLQHQGMPAWRGSSGCRRRSSATGPACSRRRAWDSWFRKTRMMNRRRRCYTD